MAVTESVVQVAPDGTGKKIDNTQVTTSQGQVLRQNTVTADPETPGARQKVTNALPGPTDFGAAVREVAPGYDSGVLALPAAIGVVTADTIRAIGILLCNRTAVARPVTVTNTAGDVYLNAYPLQPNMTVFVPLGRVTMVGVKWNTNAVDSVNGQVVGEK